ncbi:MAG: sensor histidine kinase, partial [Anaerolineae bacterium]
MLSLDAVRRPGPSWRMMGDVARRRAGPWLIATSFIQLLVSILVTFAIAWVLYSLIDGFEFFLYRRTWNILAAFDLAISLLLLINVMLLGQATISYELFTGRSLPRRGMRGQWRVVFVLGALFSAFVSTVTLFELPQIHTMLLMTIAIISLSALIGQRSWRTRQQTLAELRPFISSQRLYDNLLEEVESGEMTDLQPAFDALCRDLLGGAVGYLLPLGPLATLVSGPLTYPANREVPERIGLAGRFNTPEDDPLPVDPQKFSGAAWAIPLWSRQGLIGLFLLGDRRDNGLYAEEDIVAARTAGERLIDTMASAEITRRLIVLQRQKLVETQLLDQKTRRVLHDEVLPILHTTMLSLHGPNGKSDAIQELTSAHQMIADLLAQMPGTSIDPVRRLGLITALRKLPQNEMLNQFNEVHWDIPEDVEIELNNLPAQTSEILYYAAREALRNAAKHGRGRNKNRLLNIKISGRFGDGIQLVIQDDGVGLAQTVPAPNPNGAGQGLTLHSTMLAVMGGQLMIDNGVDGGTQVVIQVQPRRL